MSTQAGTILNGEGEVFANSHGSVERIVLHAGGSIARHNHPGQDVIVTVLSGGLDVVLDDGEKHPLHAGDTLAFNGRHYFAADATADTVAIHTTIRE